MKSKELLQKYGIVKELSYFAQMTEACQREIDYIVTLGGDGTILWASKQFNGDFIPPMITFNQGSLGFMTNFVFADHTEVLENLFDFQSNKDTHSKPEVLGLDSRLRLKFNMG